MKGAGRELSIGQRVAFYRRRRGLTQQTLAGLVGRTVSWLEKVENGRAPLDRVPVICELARALDISLHDLLPDDVADTDTTMRGRSVPALRELVLSYRAVNPRFALNDRDVAPVGTEQLRGLVNDVWTAYQDSRFGYVVMRLHDALPKAYRATLERTSATEAERNLAHLYHAAASVLVKLGDVDLARVCADRGDISAQRSNDPVALLSLQRSIAHSLLSNGQYNDAVAIVREGVIEAGEPTDPAGISVVGTLMLVGATASARAGERVEAAAFLRHANRLADRLGTDRNEVWTSFGPTNVAIHRVTVAADLGDLHQAVELGLALDASVVSLERRVRHELELSRALARVGRPDESLALLLSAEVAAPDQVRRHFLTHELVHGWMRTTRTRPSAQLVALARRLGHAA